MSTITKPEITFYEGSLHTVTINLPTGLIDGYTYQAKIQVRKSDNSELPDFEFSTTANTLTIVGNQIFLEIPANLTNGKDGIYKWQLMLYTDDTDAIKFTPEKFIIKPSITNL